jgi:hypothetical protein
MTKEFSVELEPHKAEFDVPDDFDVSVDVNKNFGVAISRRVKLLMYAKIVPEYPKPETMETRRILRGETNSKAQNIWTRYGLHFADASTMHDQIAPSTSKAPIDDNLDNHEGLYLVCKYDTGAIVERGIYWFNENTICDIYFIYFKDDTEMSIVIKEIKASAKLTALN